MPKSRKPRIVAVLNNKGGVGKTVLATEIPLILGKMGERVLLIDLDPQRNLTLNMGFYQQAGPAPERTIAPSIHEPHKAPLVEAVAEVPIAQNVYLIPGHSGLAEVAELIAAGALSDTRLDDLIDDLIEEDGEVFDWIFIDCPPGLGVLSNNALIAADEVLVPVDLRNTNSLVGVNYLVRHIQGLGKRAPRNGLYLVGNMFSEPGGRNANNDQEGNRERLSEIGLPVAKTTIKARAAIFKAHNRNAPLAAQKTGLTKGGRAALANLCDLAGELKFGTLKGKNVAASARRRAA